MLERPGLFQAFIASSPAAGYAGDWLFQREEAFVKSGQKLDASLFMTVGSDEWPDFVKDVHRFRSITSPKCISALTGLRSLPSLCDVVRRDVRLHRPSAWRAANHSEQAYLPCLPGVRVLDGEGIAP